MTVTTAVCSSCETEVEDNIGSTLKLTTGEIMQLCSSMGADLPDHECVLPQCVCACPLKPEKPSVKEPNTSYLHQIPDCDICRTMGVTVEALYDAMMSSTGQWAYMCDKHMQERGAGLGVGRGQRLALRSD